MSQKAPWSLVIPEPIRWTITGVTAPVIGSIVCLMIAGRISALMESPDVGLEIFLYFVVALVFGILAIPAILYLGLIALIVGDTDTWFWDNSLWYFAKHILLLLGVNAFVWLSVFAKSD
ncbi:MAG: hypothetical protein AAFP91_06170 [Pseudomonadota bacterium]